MRLSPRSKPTFTRVVLDWICTMNTHTYPIINMKSVKHSSPCRPETRHHSYQVSTVTADSTAVCASQDSVFLTHTKITVEDVEVHQWGFCVHTSTITEVSTPRQPSALGPGCAQSNDALFTAALRPQFVRVGTSTLLQRSMCHTSNRYSALHSMPTECVPIRGSPPIDHLPRRPSW